MSDIFISYARADKPKAQVLAETLEPLGWSVWWDSDIRIGGKFDEIIKAELDDAKSVIVIWSTASVQSEWVKDEAAEASKRGILVPVLIEEVEIPFGFGFRRIQAANLVGWKGSLDHPELARLVHDLSEVIKRPPRIVPAIRPKGNKFKLAIAGAVALLFALGLGIYLTRGVGLRKAATQTQTSSAVPNPKPTEKPVPKTPVVCNKPYQQMTDSERIAFVDDRARRISLMLGRREYNIPPDARLYIKRRVDAYAERIGTGSTSLWHDDLNLVFKRARPYVPIISFVFKQYDVPPVIGIYIPLIECEYRTCIVSPQGSMGLFQFIPDTARNYGLDPADRCQFEKETPAAARYIKANLARFESDPMKTALSIISYNRGQGLVQQYLNQVTVLNDEEAEQRFWGFVDSAPDIYPDLISDNRQALFGLTTGKYIHGFFAAAIVGEYPECFGLDMQPLSTYDKVTGQP